MKVFNSAAQHFNHSFFWNCLSEKEQEASGILAAAIEHNFGSLDSFKKEFSEAAGKLFGSGWVWLVQTIEGKLVIRQYKDADTPSGTDTPLLTLDVWEHAYYLDHQNDRVEFIKSFWNHVNWKYVQDQLR